MPVVSQTYSRLDFPVSSLDLFGATAGSIDTAKVGPQFLADVTFAQVQSGITLFDKMFIKNDASVTCNGFGITFSSQSGQGSIALGTSTDNSPSTTIGTVTRPTSASTLSFTSTSASDTQVATIFGSNLATAPFAKSENLTLTGLTAAVSVNSYTDVYYVSLASAAVGTITCTSNAGAVTVLTIAIAATLVQNVYVSKNAQVPVTLYVGGAVGTSTLVAGSSIGFWLRRIIPALAVPATGVVESLGTVHTD